MGVMRSSAFKMSLEFLAGLAKRLRPLSIPLSQPWKRPGSTCFSPSRSPCEHGPASVPEALGLGLSPVFWRMVSKLCMGIQRPRAASSRNSWPHVRFL